MEKETTGQLITRVMNLHASLETLGKPLEDIHLVGAITKALNANVHYAQSIRMLKTVGGHLSLRALQNAFASGSSQPTVPGAFYTHGDEDPSTHENDPISMLVKKVNNL